MVVVGAPPLLLGVGAAAVLGDRLAEVCWVPGSVPGPPMLLGVGLGLVGTFVFTQKIIKKNF